MDLQNRVLLFIILIVSVAADKKQPTADDKKLPVIYISYSHAEYGTYLLLFLHIVFFAVVRYAVQVTEIIFPYSIVSLALGMTLGIASIYSQVVAELCTIEDKILASEFSLYLSSIIFCTAFCLEIHTFFRSLHQILIISLPVAFLSSTLTGFMMRNIVPSIDTFLDGLLFGSLFISIYPFGLMRWIGETGSQMKCVNVLMNGETLVANVFGFYVYQIVKMNIDNWVKHWYQVMMGALRLIFCGIPVAYLLGLIGNCLIRAAYNDGLHLSLVTIIMCYFSFYFCEAFMSTGILASLITGIMMGIERSSLPADIEKSIKEFWKVISLITNSVALLVSGIMIPQIVKSESVAGDKIMRIFVTYLLCNLTRFLSFLLFGPILNRLGYGLPFKHLIICVWAGLKNPVILCYAYLLQEMLEQEFDDFFLHAAGVYLLFIIINGTFFPVMLNILNLSTLSMARQINMNNCLKYVLQARERTIAILKMDRFLSDANWPLVTNATDMKHPYRRKTTDMTAEGEHGEDEEDYFMGYRFTVCPDCKKRILNEPTNKEMREMTKEAKIRILKLRKIFYSRRFEFGLVTKEGVRIAHQSVETALDTREKQIEIDGLIKMFHKENSFFRWMLNCLMYWFKMKEDTNKQPKNPFRLGCYKIISHLGFHIFSYCLTVCNMTAVIFFLVTTPEVNTTRFYVLFACNLLINILFIFEILIKILGYSWLYIYHGIHKYFKSFMDIIIFIVMCATTSVLVINVFGMTYESFGHSKPFLIFLYTIESIRLLRCLYLCQLLVLCRNLYTKIVRHFDLKIDRHRSLAYELGKNFICGEEEIIENLPTIVDNDKIREELKHKFEIARLLVTKTFGASQKERPWVAVTTKTKLVIETVLNSMKEDIQGLKASGWTDDLEYNKLLRSLSDRYRYAQTITSVQPLSPKFIFREVVWMMDNEKMIDFLFENVTSKRFDPGDTIFTDGEISEGVYLLISGLLLLNYRPQKVVIDKLLDGGVLPVVDYLSLAHFESSDALEFIIPGNTIGELSSLTERSYNCTITAETHSYVFVLRREVIRQAIEQDADPINGLECRMWKSIAFRFATSILMNVTAYRSLTLQNVEYILERAFMPNISNVKIFVVNEMMEDLLLIEGVAVDMHTRDVFTGPCYIPRSVQRLILPKSSSLNMEVEVETKLMIIPAKDFDEYEIMMKADETCEMVSGSATKCLQHIVQDRIAKHKIPKRGQRSKVKVSDDSAMSKSRITFASTEEEEIEEKPKSKT